MAKIGYNTLVQNLRKDMQDLINKQLQSGIEPTVMKTVLDMFNFLLIDTINQKVREEATSLINQKMREKANSLKEDQESKSE